MLIDLAAAQTGEDMFDHLEGGELRALQAKLLRGAKRADIAGHYEIGDELGHLTCVISDALWYVTNN